MLSSGLFIDGQWIRAKIEAMHTTSTRTSGGDSVRRTMGRPKKTAKAATPPDQHKVPMTGFRIPPELIKALDAYVDRQNEKAPRGFTTNRTAVVIELIRRAVEGDAPAPSAPEPEAPTSTGKPS